MRQSAPVRVLIADDHELVRRGLAMLLETEAGIQVAGEARTGREAVEGVLRERPDVLLVDLKMPDLDGLGVLKAVKARAPGTRVVLLTGLEVDEAILEAVYQGADGFLFKDVPPAELCKAIRVIAAGEVYLQPAVAARLVRLLARSQEEPPARRGELTAREREVLRLMARGHTNQEIAELTGLAVETVRSHVKNILQKLEQPNRTRAVLFALQSGLVDLAELRGP
ncbi:MAG: response regulator transcription factor [Armatimonadota bacterium]|nr:response regulator transcription factor [Armatimonadota bacterium]MDR5675902.1 response regulator transcription factor [Armatimonadota bacterium]MDR7386850.1 response regulator transcription factor [Armatimonadota bacterium]MDR7390017.1 response regulator transcription factor [Armatimonadota bacterium]MDR7394195.1 response regulator transcription factor [Armatimonadota bacterium]